MVVQKQLIPISFNGGVETKFDILQTPQDKLLDLTNGKFLKGGQISKRYGYDILNNTIEGGGTIDQGQALSNYNEELVLFDGNEIYSYLEATGNWIDRGAAVSVIVESNQILRQKGIQQIHPDVALLNNIEVYAWEDSSGGIRYSVFDHNTKSCCISSGLVDIGGIKPKCISLGNKIYIFYTDDINNIFYRTINPFNPTQITSAVSLIVDGHSAMVYDATTISNNLFITYNNQDSEIILKRFNNNMSSVGSITVDGYVEPVQCLNVVGDSGLGVWVSWADDLTVNTSKWSFNLNVELIPPANVDSGISCVNLTGIEGTETAGTLQLVYEVYNATPWKERLLSTVIDLDGYTDGYSELRSVGLASKAFYFNGRNYVNVAHESTLQSTYFTASLHDDPFPLVGKINPNLGGGLRTNGLLSEAVIVENGIFLWANSIKGKVISEANDIFSLLGVNSTTLDFANSNKFLSCTQSNNLLFVGGFVQTYDGISVVEQNFHLYPENATAVPSGSDGSLGTGSYQYKIVYSWDDNRGNTFYSTTSEAITVDVIATNHVLLTIPTLRLTAKNGRSPVNIGIYRTVANGLAFHEITSEIAPLENDTTVDTVQFVDVLSDNSILSNSLIYTEGDILDNSAPPACKLISLYQNRVIVSGLEDPNLLWFSKNKFDNSNFNSTPVEFSADNVVGVDSRGGKITALGLLDDKLVIFKETAIFLMTGDGPNDTGLGGEFSVQLITTDVGCDNPNSVVEYPNGLMFKSSKGIYSLSRDVSVKYIGSPVENFNGYTISSGTLSQDSNQVIFTTSDGPAIVYDYFFDQWGTWSNHRSEDSDIFNTLFHIIKSNGRVYRQNQSKFNDNGVPFYLSWTTPNFNLAGLQGYARVFRVFLLGLFKSNHNLQISVAYDGNPAFSQFAIIDASQDQTTWGSSTTWGSDTKWGGEYVPYQFRIDLKRQLCTSFRIKVSDQQNTDYGEGYAISNMAIEVGVLPGGNRLPATKISGTQ